MSAGSRGGENQRYIDMNADAYVAMINPDMVPPNTTDKVASAIKSVTASAVRLRSNLNLIAIRLAANATPMNKNSIMHSPLIQICRGLGLVALQLNIVKLTYL